MSVTLTIPPELEREAASIPDLQQRFEVFVRHQVDLEKWRQGRYSEKARGLVANDLAQAEELRAKGVSRVEAAAMFRDIHDRITGKL